MLSEEIAEAANEILRSAGLDEGKTPKPVALTKALLGPGHLFRVHARALPGDGAFALVNGEPRIYIRTNLSPERTRWAIFHELAEWWLWREGVQDSRIENIADEIAAGLLAPRSALWRAVRKNGERYSPIAAEFTTTESCIALRIGEVTGHPMALIAPASVRARGEEFAWGTEEALRSLARQRKIPGIDRERLHDDRRRIVLRAS